MAEKKVLVTGGAGYIGSHTCKELALAGYTPIVYDNLSTGHRDLARWGEFVHGDILDTPKLAETIRIHRPLGVIHFAACSYVGESVTNPGKYFKNNVSGTLSILEAMRLEQLENIVVSGTCAVYGEPETIPIGEDTPHHPINPYGASKSFMERMLDDYEKAYAFKTASLRYFNAAGCDPEGETGERHNPETHLIPRVFMAAAGKIPALSLFGEDYPTPDGSCIRDYIHVCDLASAHRLALEQLVAGQKNLKINLGTGTGYSVKEIIEKSSTIIGKKVPFKIEQRRPGDPPVLLAKTGLAQKVLGWEARYSGLDNILMTAWQWFVKDAGKQAN